VTNTSTSLALLLKNNCSDLSNYSTVLIIRPDEADPTPRSYFIVPFGASGTR